MGDDGIYRKTEKGHAEIATRACKLGMRERALLIMVDDKTTRRELLARNTYPGAASILDSLLAQGFIELDTEAAAAAVPPRAAGNAPAASQEDVIRFVRRALADDLGPSGDDLTVLVENCRGTEELAAVLVKCREIIQGLRGKKHADAFWAGVTARMNIV